MKKNLFNRQTTSAAVDPWVDMPIATMNRDLVFSLVLSGIFIGIIVALSFYL